MTKAAWKAHPDDPVFLEMRQKVLDSASVLIRETGVAGLRLDTVARQAGLARSSLYRYFDSKEQVVFELLVYEFNKLAAKMVDATGDIENPVDRLLEIVFLSIYAYRNDPSLSQLIGPTNEKSVPLVAFALERIPDLIIPYFESYGFFESCKPQERDQRNNYLARWILNTVFSVGIFGSGGLPIEDEKEMLRKMLEPVLKS